MQVALFGGTFDPLHFGHVKLVDIILQRGLAEHVVFLPAYRPPHKDDKSDRTAFEIRLEMLRNYLKQSKNCSVSDFEARNKEKSYTFNTMTDLKSKYPNHEFSWIIGSDSLLQLHTWHRALELAQDFRFITFPRPDYPVTPEEIAPYWPTDIASKLLKSCLNDVPLFPVSSSAIRQMVRNGDDVSQFVPPEIMQSIQTYSLYR